MKVGILYPTTWQLVEKMAALFPDGVEIAGPLSDDKHYWNDPNRKMAEWKELGLSVSLDISPYREIDFSQYDLLIESVETFAYSKDWAKYCCRVECPIVVKACWTKYPSRVLPSKYIKRVRGLPVLLEMPAHLETWKSEGFKDVTVLYNPVGDWWFSHEWTGSKERILMVLAGSKQWRGGDPSRFGFEIWGRICQAFPENVYLQDGHVSYKTSLEMVELFSESRVFVNLDRPYGQGERPLTLAFTEALSAGLPVIARDLPGLSYAGFIDRNGVCTNDQSIMHDFLRKSLADQEFAKSCSMRSREIARRQFSTEVLKPKYDQVIQRAVEAFNLTRNN